jgi:cytochrome c-type biogenesis protein CcmE
LPHRFETRILVLSHLEKGMNSMKIKLVAAGAAIVVAATLLAVAGAREGWVYFLTVDEFLALENHAAKRVRLHGLVGEENVEVRPALLQADFDLEGDANDLRIAYTGVIPDMFKAGNEVVVEGQLDESGVFQADTLLTKCASKYESDDGESPHGDLDAKEAGE